MRRIEETYLRNAPDFQIKIDNAQARTFLEALDFTKINSSVTFQPIYSAPLDWQIRHLRGELKREYEPHTSTRRDLIRTSLVVIAKQAQADKINPFLSLDIDGERIPKFNYTNLVFDRDSAESRYLYEGIDKILAEHLADFEAKIGEYTFENNFNNQTNPDRTLHFLKKGNIKDYTTTFELRHNPGFYGMRDPEPIEDAIIYYSHGSLEIKTANPKQKDEILEAYLPLLKKIRIL